jgi:hypothetical protein
MKKLLLSMLVLGTATVMNAQSPVANGDMETWSSSAFSEPQEPTGWVSENIACSPALKPADPVSVTKYTSSPFLHTASAQITTVDISTSSSCPSCGNPLPGSIPDTIGVLILGSITTSAPYIIPGAAYTSKPQTFSFESQYTPANSLDSAYVVVQLSKNVAGVHTLIAQNAVEIPPSSVWAAHSFSLNYTNYSLTPDTLTIVFTSSYNRKHAAPGSTLLIDALTFTGINGIQEFQNLVKFDTYPNPSNSELNLNTDAGKVSLVNICDMSGRTIETLAITSDHTTVNTSSFAAGLYIYHAVNKDGVVQARGKFSVTR